MATIKDVAKKAGVSIATVSRVIHAKANVHPKTRLKVEEAISELGYQPSTIARSMVRKQTYAIAALIPDISNPFFTSIVRAIEDVARQHSYTVILGNSDEDPVKEADYLAALAQRQIDGLIVASTTARAELIENVVLDRKIPTVLIDRHLNIDIPDGELDVVVTDNRKAAYDAVNHLIAVGHTSIGMIAGPSELSTSSLRLEGYKQALREAGLEVSRELIYHGDFKESGGYQGVVTLFNRPDPPTALFTANNLMTLGALIALREMGLRIPDDVSIVGFDDLPWWRVVEPPLTVVQQRTYVIGSTAAQLLFARLSGHDRHAPGQVVTVHARLLERASVAPPPSR